MEINGEQVTDVYYYADMDLSEPIRKALAKKGFTRATPVQGGAIPHFKAWRDVVAKAPTGTGKTCARSGRACVPCAFTGASRSSGRCPS